MHKFVPFNQNLGPRIIDSAAVELSASNYILHSKLNSYLEAGTMTQDVYADLMKSVNRNSKEIETLMLALPGNEKARREKYIKDNT